MPIPREVTLRTLTALGVDVERGEGVLDALRSGALSYEPAPIPAEVGSRIGDAPYDDRYELTALLGHGASGAVFAAHDHVMGEDVAVKIVRIHTDREIDRMHREIAVLRMLRVPGVVGFRDEGTWDGLPFVVMDLVRGKAFPGCASRRWEDVAEVVVGLVETLARLHENGVIHRDLKPSNVLTVHGRPTLLDFGLARPQAEIEQGDGQLAGTPAYLAPEVFFGTDPSPSSDLYALGVMLYEVLGGARPHDGDSLAELVHAVLFAPVVPLAERAPDLPPVIARLVMRLLSREPDARPASALEVLRTLREGRLLPVRRPRRVGAREPLEQALAALREGRSIDVGGPPGSGRTRLVDDVEEQLIRDGLTVARAVPAVSPFGSLAGVFEPLGDEPPDLSAATALAESRLRARLSDGVVLLVDDAHRIDASSAELIRRVREHGRVLRVVTGPADVELGPLSEEDIQGLFSGPRRLLHLPDDAAAIVHARVGGLPGPVVERIGAWVRAGLARWDGDRAYVDRAALDLLGAGLEVDPLDPRGDDREIPDVLAETWRAVALLEPYATVAGVASVCGAPAWSVEARLAALVEAGLVEARGGTWSLVAHPPRQRWPQDEWVRASRAAAEALPPHAPSRLVRLLQAGDLEAVPAAARRIAAQRLDDARPGFAWAIVAEGLAAARRCELNPEVPALLSLALRLALVSSDHRLLAATHVEIARCDPEDTLRLGALCQVATRLLTSGGGRAVWDALQALEPYDDPDIELWRHRVTSFAARRMPLEVHAAWLEGVRGQVEALPGGRLNLLAWEAGIRFRNRDFEGAAEREESAWREQPPSLHGIAGALNAARTWAEAGRFDDTERILTELAPIVATGRMPVFEAYWVQVHRHTRYRRGEVLDADPELREAVAALGMATMAATTLAVEAACAWRRGEREEARVLALDAAVWFEREGSAWAGALMRALAWACGDPQDVDALLAHADAAPYPDVALQTYALLGRTPPGSLLDRLDTRYPPDARREILSREEALRLCATKE